MTLQQMTTSESAYIDFGKELKHVFTRTLDVEHDALSEKAGILGEGKKFRGVTKHKRTQRYEAHIWECKKQIYLGGFDSEYLAARSHDIMALRCKGPDCETLNFPREDYSNLVHLLPMLNKEDLISILRNYSKGNLQPMTTAVVPQANGMHGNGVTKFKYKYSSLYSGSQKPPQIRLPLSGNKRSAEGWTSPDTPLCAQKMAPKSPRNGPEDECLLPVMPLLENPCCPDDMALMYSPMDESYIFDSFSAENGSLAMEHLSGGVIFRNNTNESTTADLASASENDSFLLESSKLLNEDTLHF
jgi:hypothetical protein